MHPTNLLIHQICRFLQISAEEPNCKRVSSSCHWHLSCKEKRCINNRKQRENASGWVFFWKKIGEGWYAADTLIVPKLLLFLMIHLLLPKPTVEKKCWYTSCWFLWSCRSCYEDEIWREFLEEDLLIRLLLVPLLLLKLLLRWHWGRSLGRGSDMLLADTLLLPNSAVEKKFGENYWRGPETAAFLIEDHSWKKIWWCYCSCCGTKTLDENICCCCYGEN